MSKIPEIYGSMVFNEHTMQERLPSATYKDLMKTIKKGEPLNLEVANVVAHAMKEWAIEKGATHYTHWFQPLTGITAEKHDSFIDPAGDGTRHHGVLRQGTDPGRARRLLLPVRRPARNLRGPRLHGMGPHLLRVRQGRRAVHPHRVLFSYTGEALDKKTPLLRSMNAIDEQAMPRAEAVRQERRPRHHHRRPRAGVLPDQIRRITTKRQDLILTGRTLFGYSPPKGQELEEHYFGAITPQRRTRS